MSNKNKKIVKGTSANHGDSKASVQSDKLKNSSSIMNMSKQLLFPPGAGPSEFNVDTWRLYLSRTIASNTILAPFISIFSSKDGKYSTIRHLPDEPFVNDMDEPDKPSDIRFPIRGDYDVALAEYNALNATYKEYGRREAKESKVHSNLLTKFVQDEETTRQNRPYIVSHMLDHLSNLSVDVLIRECKWTETALKQCTDPELLMREIIRTHTAKSGGIVMKNYASTLRTVVNFKQGPGEKIHPLEQRLSADICALESFGKITIDQELAATLFMDSLDTNIHSKFLTDTHNHAVNEVKDYPSSV